MKKIKNKKDKLTFEEWVVNISNLDPDAWWAFFTADNLEEGYNEYLRQYRNKKINELLK